MDPTIDFEAMNAREWDESSQLSESHPLGSIEKSSESVSITVTKSIAEVQEIAYTGNLPSPKTRAVALQPPRDDSQPISSYKPRGWAKGPQLVTTVKAKSQKVDEKVAMQRRTFRNSPTQSNFDTTSYYFWPNKDIPPTEILGDKLRNVDSIREVYKTYIDWDPSMQSIRLRSPTGQNVKQVVEALKAAIQAARVEAAGYAQYYIVQPPSTASMTDRVSPVFGKSTSPDHQPLVESVILTGRRLSVQNQGEWQRRRDILADRQRYSCFEKIHDALSKFRSLRDLIRLRVHFGTIYISVYRKEFQSPDFDYDALSTMMGEGRTKATLIKNIRPPLDGSKIIEKINRSTGIFCPADSFASSSLKDVKPKYGVVILARTPTNVQLRLEADIDKVHEGGIGKFQIGTVNYYLHDTHVPRFSLAVMNLEGYSDWALEAVTNKQISEQPPRALQDLVRGCISRHTAERVDNDGDPYPAINLQVPPDVNIDGVLIKTIRQYRLQDTANLLVEVTTYREWCTQDTAGDPTLACGVVVYDKDWDRTLAPTEELTRTQAFSDDLHELFPATSGLHTGFSGFWACVSRIQEFLS